MRRGSFAIMVYRFGHRVRYHLHVPLVWHVLWFLYQCVDVVCLRLLLSVDLPAQCRVGKRFTLLHGGNGLVIHPDAVLGDDVTLFHQVTIGQRTGTSGVPTIGNGVSVGAGAKLLGGIRIGDGATVGANAVVLTDVPDGCTAVGVPARILAAPL